MMCCCKCCLQEHASFCSLAGKTVAKNYLVNSLLTNNAISLSGIGITVIGLQVSVGESFEAWHTALLY